MVDTTPLARKTVFENTKWLSYCICNGCGIGDVQPLILGDVKNLCLHSQFGTTDISNDEGLCNEVSACVCLTGHFALPPAKSTPMCVICNKRFGEKKRETGSEFKKGLFDIDKVIDTPFWLYYCFCFGASVHPPKATGPFCGAQFKRLCCAGSTVLEKPVGDGGLLCSQVQTTLCCWSECSMPPAPGNPKLAVCTWKLNKDHSAASPTPPGQPVQIEM